jgi:hypothetical protein
MRGGPLAAGPSGTPGENVSLTGSGVFAGAAGRTRGPGVRFGAAPWRVACSVSGFGGRFPVGDQSARSRGHGIVASAMPSWRVTLTGRHLGDTRHRPAPARRLAFCGTHSPCRVGFRVDQERGLTPRLFVENSSGCGKPYVGHSFFGLAGHVWRQDDVWQAPQRRVSREWLNCVGIQCGSRQMSRLQRHDERCLIHKLTARRIYQNRARFHRFNHCCIDHAVCRWRQPRMQGDDVCHSEHFAKRKGRYRLRCDGRQATSGRNHTHAESRRDACDPAPDRAKSDDTDRLPLEYLANQSIA